MQKWGGSFKKANGMYVDVINTCSIDNYLFGIWVIKKIAPSLNIDKHEHALALNSILANIETKNWNNARQIWYQKVMKRKLTANIKRIDFFGTLEKFFLQYMYDYQTHDLIQKCRVDCINNGNTLIVEKSYLIQLEITKNTVQVVNVNVKIEVSA